MGEGAGEGTRDQPPSRTGTIHAPGLAGGRSGLDGGDVFAPEARPHPGQSSPHTLLTLPRTSRDQQQSPPSAPPTGGGGGGGGGGRDSAPLRPRCQHPPCQAFLARGRPSGGLKPRVVTPALILEKRVQATVARSFALYG